ncbi:MAG TPA: polyprenol monophosphomannose synthase [Anaerolineales bacterium]|nr:polyprenol monophosphomannose synthase [Anaerolineales bacterium]
MRPLTVVVPTYNEVSNLPSLIDALVDLSLPNLKILIVDDASPDGTGRLADDLAGRMSGTLSVIHRSGKLGLGSAYLKGFQSAIQAGAQAIGQMDADFSHSPRYLPEFLQRLESTDAVFGSRYVTGGRLDERWGIGRVFLSKFGNSYARVLLGLKVRDATGGFRIWRAETLQAIPLGRISSEGYVFQVEMAYLAQRLGFEIAELPIYFEDRRIGQSKMSLRIQIEAAVRVWLLPFIYRKLRPARS